MLDGVNASSDPPECNIKPLQDDLYPDVVMPASIRVNRHEALYPDESWCVKRYVLQGYFRKRCS